MRKIVLQLLLVTEFIRSYSIFDNNFNLRSFGIRLSLFRSKFFTGDYVYIFVPNRFINRDNF